MTMLTALPFIAMSGLALLLCHYCFIRFMGNDDTEYFAELMSQIRESDSRSQAAKAKRARAA
jgi:hypothetical protein